MPARDPLDGPYARRVRLQFVIVVIGSVIAWTVRAVWIWATGP